jgi:ribosomal protein S18 acetylase RimI-like enzyme
MNVTLADVAILEFESRLAPDFERLNREWLESLFTVEPIDARILGEPERYIIDSGGDILFAEVRGSIVGTVALKSEGNGRYELTKMAVTASARGLGAGRRLGEAAIDRYHALGGTSLFLESHSSLLPALALYESLGFRHHPRPAPSEYARSDVYMEYRG